MQDLTEKNTHLSQELQECKAQLEATLAAAGGDTETPSGNAYFKKDFMVCGVRISLTIILQRAPN